MNSTIDVPSNVVIRDLMLTIWFRRRRFLSIIVACAALAVVVAYQFPAQYRSTSSLLVLLGPEYGFRPTAGQQFISNFNVGPTELLQTESDILNSKDLHEQVIRHFDLATLYPSLLKPRSWLEIQFSNARAALYGWLRQDPHQAMNEPDANIKRATTLFEQNFGVGVDKKSDIIHLSFQHKDAMVSAEVLRVLEADYFKLRAKLFADKQAAILRLQEGTVGAQLAAADAELAEFKNTHDISNFEERQKVLLTQQGTIEGDLTKAETAAASQQARLDKLMQQLRLAAGQPAKNSQANAAAPLQGMVEAYREYQQQTQTTYRGSPAYDLARTAMMRAQEEVAKMRSTQAFNLQQEVDKTQAELRAQEATRDALRPELAKLRAELAAITTEQDQLHALERSRGIIEDNYKAVAKLASDRTVVETIETTRQPSVRVVEAPQIPYLPLPIRRQIAMVGLILGVVIAVAVTLLSMFFRGVYLRPEALEADTGLAVLAVVPDRAALAMPALLIAPE